jgi:surface protein
MSQSFMGCRNLELSATDVPVFSGVTNFGNLFRETKVNSPTISARDISGVTVLGAMFEDNQVFNQNLSSWDTSSVTNSQGMFK